jgi:serine/threonine-protein phosphatase PGAM5
MFELHTAEAKKQHPELFRSWREDPLNFNVDGVYPVVELWAKAKLAWEEILSSPVSFCLISFHSRMLSKAPVFAKNVSHLLQTK